MITWLAEPLRDPRLERLHSIFELRERHTHVLLTDHLAFHLLQLPSTPSLSQPAATGYAGRVERWARFFTASDEVTRGRLAEEDPIMHLATQTLEDLSLDPNVRRLARERADELMLYKIDLADSRAEGREEGRRETLVEVLLMQLAQRFGNPPAALSAGIRAATAEQLETWLGRLTMAHSPDEIFAR